MIIGLSGMVPSQPAAPPEATPPPGETMRHTVIMTATSDVPPPRKVSFAAAARILAERDPVIARLLEQTGPPRLSLPLESHFGTLVRAIVYQQLAGRAAAAIHGR